MNERVQALKARLKVNEFPICTEKVRLVTESMRQTEGEPLIVRRAKATAHFLDNRTIFIEDDELIVGNIAQKPMGMEAGTIGSCLAVRRYGRAEEGRALPFPKKTKNSSGLLMISI